jgi:hypothetical protein
MKAYERVEVWPKPSLTSAPDGVKLLVHALATLSRGRSPMVTFEQDARWSPTASVDALLTINTTLKMPCSLVL